MQLSCIPHREMWLSVVQHPSCSGQRTVVVVQSVSHVQLFVTPWTAAHQASLPITDSQSLLKLMSIDGDAIQPSHPLLPASPFAFSLSQHQSLFQ